MKIALIGATGFLGSGILREALNRGHQVTAIVRHPEKLPQHPDLVAQRGDVTNKAETNALVVGHDAAISAYSPGRNVPDTYQHIFVNGSPPATKQTCHCAAQQRLGSTLHGGHRVRNLWHLRDLQTDRDA